MKLESFLLCYEKHVLRFALKGTVKSYNRQFLYALVDLVQSGMKISDISIGDDRYIADISVLDRYIVEISGLWHTRALV